MKKEDIIRLHGIEYYEEYKRRNCERIKMYRIDDEYRKRHSMNVSRYNCKRYKEDPEFKERIDASSKLLHKQRYASDKEFRNNRRKQTKLCQLKRYVKDGRFDLVENYDKAKVDNFKGWAIHHRDEIRLLPSGMIALRTREELIKNDRYYNCPPNELIWLTLSEHTHLHRKYRS